MTIFPGFLLKKIEKDSIKMEPTWVKNFLCGYFLPFCVVKQRSFTVTALILQIDWRYWCQTIFTSFSCQDKRLDKGWWHLQSCIFDFRPFENAHFRAKNTKCVIASARICRKQELLPNWWSIYKKILTKCSKHHIYGGFYSLEAIVRGSLLFRRHCLFSTTLAFGGWAGV